MRVWGTLLILVVLALVVVFYLQGTAAKKSVDAVDIVARSLQQQEQVEGGVAVDRDAAKRIISSLEQLVEAPDGIRDSMSGLREVSELAARWAKAAPSPSADLHLAVSIREAAGQLREYGVDASDSHLRRARTHLVAARDGLLGKAGASGPTDGIADRLKNIERAQKERYQDVNELGR